MLESPIVLAIVASLCTLVATLVAINFMPSEKRIERRLERLFSLDDSNFDRELSVLLGPPLIAGNRIKVLRNGDEIFPAMLAAIREATRSVTFESYIYWSGEIGHAFADALAGPSISTRDREEFTGMVIEKHVAVSQACMGIFLEGVRFQQQFALSLLTGATPRLHAAQAKSASSRIANAGLAPFHRKAVANAKRLARMKLR